MIYGRSPGSAMERIEDVPVCAAMELGTGLPHGETHPAEARAGCTESFEIRCPPAWGLVPLEYAKRGVLEPGGSRRIKEIEPEDRKSRLYLFFGGDVDPLFQLPAQRQQFLQLGNDTLLLSERGEDNDGVGNITHHPVLIADASGVLRRLYLNQW